MRKEVLIAIIIGFGLGLVLTFFVYKTQFSDQTETTIITPLAEEKNLPTKAEEQILTVTSPIDQSISKEAKTDISGSAQPLSWILILGEKGEKIVQTDNKGSFQTDLLLVSGENEIKITSINEKGEENSKTLTIVYSTAEI